MDNDFTSATLLLCLATHDIFAVGTVREKKQDGHGRSSAVLEGERLDHDQPRRHAVCAKWTPDGGGMDGLQGGALHVVHAHLRERLCAA